MKNMLGWVGCSIGGAVGWWLGEYQSITLAVVLSGVFSGLGMFYTRKWVERYLE